MNQSVAILIYSYNGIPKAKINNTDGLIFLNYNTLTVFISVAKIYIFLRFNLNYFKNNLNKKKINSNFNYTKFL